MDNYTYKTIEEKSEGVLKEKGSRFINNLSRYFRRRSKANNGIYQKRITTPHITATPTPSDM